MGWTELLAAGIGVFGGSVLVKMIGWMSGSEVRASMLAQLKAGMSQIEDLRERVKHLEDRLDREIGKQMALIEESARLQRELDAVRDEMRRLRECPTP